VVDAEPPAIAEHANAVNELSFDEFQRIYGRVDALMPAQAAALFESAPFRWWVAAGWSLESGAEQRRFHEDLEIAVPREDLAAIREWLREYHLWDVGGGSLRHLAPGVAVPEEHEQLWLRRDAYSPWLMDLMLTPVQDGVWFYKRDRRIQRPLAEVIVVGANGIPLQRPEITLLYKARRLAPKDELDFAAVAPQLDAASRLWLREAIALAESEGHPWLVRLS
jgi:hypothetical protein